MCTLCLSDMGELRDEWLREPKPSQPALPTAGLQVTPTVVATLAARTTAMHASYPPAAEAA